MKKIIYSAAAILSSFLFMGCPYEANFGLESTPANKFPTELTGDYEEETTSENPKLYKITKDNDYVASISEIKNKGKDDEETTYYKAFVTKIDSLEFLSLRELNSDNTEKEEPKYYFYKIVRKASGIKVKLHPVTANITEVFNTSEDMKAFFKKHGGLSFFYDKDDIKKFIRAEE